jgi:polar amino acid transport system substrate-binding protein
MKLRHLGIAGAALVALSLAGCSGAAETTPSDDPSTNTTAEAQIAPPTIITEGTLTICTALSISSPPSYFYDDAHEPTGAEVELGEAIAENLGLKAEFRDTDFAALIPTLQAHQCDIVMSGLYMRPERLEVVDMLPYLVSGTQVITAKGSGFDFTGIDDSLCGHKFGAVTGTTAAGLAQEQIEKCKADGNELNYQETNSVTSGLQQLANGQIDAYGDSVPLVLYYMQLSPDAYELAGDTFGQIEVGLATPKDNTDLKDAVTDALTQLQDDGTYEEILASWNLQDLSVLAN